MTAPAPLSLIALLIATIAIAFVADQPIVILAIAIGALLLALAAGRRALPIVAAGAISAAGLVLLTPILGANGNLIVAELPRLPLLDGEVTAEELTAGAVLGLRLLAVTAMIGAVLILVDQDRMLALAMRLAPRSALACALAARALPTLRRDATALTETARGRGAALTTGNWLGRGRRAAPLVVPLVGSSLERSLDVAEAMSARGYGAGPRARVSEPPLARRDAAIFVCAAAVAGAGIAAASLGALGYDFYPQLAPLSDVAAIVSGLAIFAALAVAAWAARG